MKESFLKYYLRNTWMLIAICVIVLAIYVSVYGYDNDALIWIGISSAINIIVLIGRIIEYRKL